MSYNPIVTKPEATLRITFLLRNIRVLLDVVEGELSGENLHIIIVKSSLKVFKET